MLYAIWLPLAKPISILLEDNSNLVNIVNMALLFVEFLVLWQFWSRKVYKNSRAFSTAGLSLTVDNRREFVFGLLLGFWLCWGLFLLEAVLGWVRITTFEANLIRIIGEGLLSAVGIGFAEELLFRGWLLTELERDYAQNTVLWVSAGLFALAHFIKPLEEIIRTLVTFPALILLGLTLAIAKKRCGDRLGICVGIHGGLVWGYYIVNVGRLIEYTNRVPAWITGIDGNPIAGLMGLLFLTLLVIGVSQK